MFSGWPGTKEWKAAEDILSRGDLKSVYLKMKKKMKKLKWQWKMKKLLSGEKRIEIFGGRLPGYIEVPSIVRTRALCLKNNMSEIIISYITRQSREDSIMVSII